jgi:hypothetical protein
MSGLHDLFDRAKALFDLVAPQEYGFDQEAKEEIGVLTSLPLLRKVWRDLDEAKTTGKSLACFYFTYVNPRNNADKQEGITHYHFCPLAIGFWTPFYQCPNPRARLLFALYHRTMGKEYQ